MKKIKHLSRSCLSNICEKIIDLKKCSNIHVIILSFILVTSPALATDTLVKVDWDQFLSKQDMIYEELPLQWNEGAFVGNGELGIMFYINQEDNRLEFHLGRADVTDHRKAPNAKSSIHVKGTYNLFDYPRLDIGKLVLYPNGKILDGKLRLALWNGEIIAQIATDKGTLNLRIISLRGKIAQVILLESSEKTIDNKQLPWKWEFIEGNADSPRAQANPQQAEKAKYQGNPLPIIGSKNGYNYVVQPLLAGGDYATLWKEVKSRDNSKSTLFVTTANEIPKRNSSQEVAQKYIDECLAESLDSLIQQHQNWWHAYYPKSFLSIPDRRLEAFYWIQMYKLGSAWSEDAPAIDLAGPWFRVNSWPSFWWNLNIQLTYLPIYTANRLEIGENFIQLVDNAFDNIFINSIKNKNLGDFVWAMHNYFLQYSYAGDWEKINQKWSPKAEILADGFISRLKENSNGKFGLPQMASPEYQGFKAYDDTNYNLALLRWLLITLVEIDKRSIMPSLEKQQKWQTVLNKLVDAPVDENGLMIGSNQSVDMSHRHYSHLLALYPLFLMNPDEPKARELLTKSMLHWHKIENGKALAGYSFTGGASMYAALGMGNEAISMLNDFLNNIRGMGKVLPNTIYTESGGYNPVIETPLHGAAAIMDLLLQSWHGKIRVFPAIPNDWQSAEFYHLRADNGFLVSAVRDSGKTSWVEITNLAGAPCILKVLDWNGNLNQKSKRLVAIKEMSQGEYEIDLKKGETILISPHSLENLPPVSGKNSISTNPFGVKKGQSLKGKQFYKTMPKRLNSETAN